MWRKQSYQRPGPAVICAVGILTAGVVPERAVAQDGNGSPAVVLSVPLSVRSAGLQGSGAALVGHAGAVFANPAGIATLAHIGIEGGYRSVPSDGYVASGALAWRLRQFDVGAAIGYLDFGTDASAFPALGIPTGVNAYEFVGVGSLVYRFGIIALAGNGKYVRRTIGTQIDRAISADAGIAIAIFDIMAFGFSIQNIGGNWREVSTIAMPRLTRFGFTMNYVDPQETFRLMSTLEFQWPKNQGSRFVFGGEAGVVVRGVGIIGRSAYGTRPTGSTMPRFTFGGSVELTRLSLDYAYQKRDGLGESVHRFGLRLSL